MALAPTGYINQEKLAADIQRIVESLGPEVVRVRHSVGADWTDEPSIFVRVILTDAASREEVLGDVAGRIRRSFFEELKPLENWGLNLYTSFRNQSESEAVNDPAWA